MSLETKVANRYRVRRLMLLAGIVALCAQAPIVFLQVGGVPRDRAMWSLYKTR
jgi:hypothetical protein